ncbi:hypothetical protein LZ30DRAFT_762226 [Colletotrichum cereale]|nr:hypothetical protein LZ30DRAFT_762226 [Colletotrichum cereale]
MAPNPLCLVWREQITDNLRLISGRSAVIDIYTSRHPNKSFTIYAVKVHRGKRQELLSATGRDLEDAFENLHTKSSQEVFQFIDANGFAFPRGVKSISGRRDDDDGSETSGSEASTVSASDVLSVSAVSSDSEDDNARRGKKAKASSRRKSKHKSKKHSRHHGSSSSSEEEEEEESESEPEIAARRRLAAVVPVTRPPYIPAAHIPGSQYPPPPPPGWRGPPTRVHPRGPVTGMPPPTFPPGMCPPQHLQGLGAPVVPGVPTAPSKPVRLVVKWRGHGEKKIIENCAPSHRALQRAALAHVRSQWQTFDGVVAQEMTPGRLWGLGAKVRRVALGKDMYAISAAGGDDLGMYYKAEDIPMFEIDVDHDGSIMPPPPPPQQHHPQH